MVTINKLNDVPRNSLRNQNVGSKLKQWKKKKIKAHSLTHSISKIKKACWCLFLFPTKVLNIHNFHMNVTPKMGVHLGVIGIHLLHSPLVVKVCFTPKHTPLTSWVFTLHT